MSPAPRVVVVDANLGVRRAVARALSKAGYDVATASDGRKALVLIRANRPQVVLLHAELPDMSGSDVLRQIREDPELVGVSVAVVGPDDAASRTLEADDYIVRPIANGELVERVRSLLRRRELSDQQKLARLNRLYAVSSGINEAIVRTRQRQELYERACRIAVERGGLLMAWVGLAQPDGSLLPVASWGDDAGYLASITVWFTPELLGGRGPAGRAFRTRQPSCSNDIAADAETFASRAEALARGYRSCAAFPLTRGDRATGVFVVYSGTAGDFDTEELHLLGALAGNLSFADEAQHRDEERQRIERIQVREAQVLDRISSGATLADVLDRIARGVEEIIPGALGSILLLDPDGPRLRSGAAPNLPEAYNRAIDGALIGPATGSCGTAAYRAERVVVADVETDPLWADYRELAREHGLRACWATPVFDTASQVIATFAVYYREPRAPEAADLDFIDRTAHIVGIAIERDRRERELRESQSLLRVASRISRLGAWQVKVADGAITWSDEVRDIYDVPADYVPTAEGALEFFTPDSRLVIHEAFRACRNDGTPFDVESQVVTMQGRRLWVRSLGEAVRDIDGDIVRVQGALQDITERKQAEASVRSSEERFRLLSRATNDAIWDWTMADDVLWWNEGYEKLFGYHRDTADPTVGSWRAHLHPEDRDRVIQSVHAVVDNGGMDWSEEYRFRRSDGTYAYVMDRGHVIRDADGRAVRMIGGMTDISERRLAEEKLREQATLLDKAQDAILVRGLDHRVRYWNRSAERLYGWTAAEATGRLVTELIYRDATEFMAATAHVIAKGEWLGELEQVTKQGELLIVEARWTLVRGDDGATQSILAINTDITQRKRLEQQYLRAQRMESIGTLAGGIAHDINNVLAPVLMAIGVLRRDEHDQDRLEILSTIESSARRGADLVGQVLSFARGIGGRRIDVDLRDVLRDLAKLVRDTFPKNIDVESGVGPELWTIAADPTQIHQVLLNLCVNARDAMPHGGRLTIVAENVVLDERDAARSIEVKAGPYLRIDVTDSGEGIPKNLIEKIFDPFFTTKEIGKGTGLGLATSLAIVKSHGGFFRVASDVGVGTRFRLYLPAQRKTTADREAEAASSLPRGRGETILVVDDEAGVRQITKRALEAFGYRVLLAADGAEGLSLYNQHRPEIALVLTDMMMPMMDGPTMIHAIKAVNPDVRVICASGLAADGKVAEARAAGAMGFLPKPYTVETMLQVFRDALKERR